MTDKEHLEIEIQNYTKFVNTYLDKEEGLAGIVIRLKNRGLESEMAREIVKEVAKSHTAKVKSKAQLSLILGVLGVLVFAFIGLNSKSGMKFFVMSIGSFFGGIYQYLSSRKRLKYLNSLN